MEKEKILLRLPQELKANISELARKKGISTTGLILIALDEFLKKQERREDGNRYDCTT